MLQKYLHNFYEWPKWEALSHHTLLALIIYIAYLFISNKNNRTTTNILLLAVIVRIGHHYTPKH